jgi:hypothetical protein
VADVDSKAAKQAVAEDEKAPVKTNAHAHNTNSGLSVIVGVILGAHTIERLVFGESRAELAPLGSS